MSNLLQSVHKSAEADIMDLLLKIRGVGLVPMAMVCDMCTKNVVLWKSIGVTIAMPYFQLDEGIPVYCVADAPHLIKLKELLIFDCVVGTPY